MTMVPMATTHGLLPGTMRTKEEELERGGLGEGEGEGEGEACLR